MAITALYGCDGGTYRLSAAAAFVPPRPMLSAIGMSFVLSNFSQVAQGARVKPVPPIIRGGYTLHEGAGGFVVQLSNIQIVVVITTVVLLLLFTWLVARTRLGRDMRACEQDQTMAALLGVDVDRTISMTFVIGAALAAVAGMMYLLYYGLVDFFMGFVAGIKAFTAAVLGGIGSLPGAMLGGLAIGLIETFWYAWPALVSRAKGSHRNLGDTVSGRRRRVPCVYGGPHWEGEEPKPMMHGHEKSDLVIVAMKPANKAKEAHCGGVCGGERSGVGGAKGGGQGEYAPAQHVLDPEPGSRDKRAGAYTATFAVTHPRWEPYAGKPHVRFCAGGVR